MAPRKSIKKEPADSLPQRSVSIEQLSAALKKCAAGEKKTRAAALRIWEEEGIKPPLIVISSQHLRVKRLVQFIQESLGESAANSYFGPELSTVRSIQPIIEALESVSLFSRSPLIVIYEADGMRASAGDALAQSLQHGHCEALLVLAAARWEKKASFMTKVSSLASTLVLEPLAGKALQRWIEKEAQRHAVKITAEAAALLEQCYSDDMSRLAQELAKLSLLVVPRGTIDRALVEKISFRTPEYSSFQLFSEIAKRGQLESAALVQKILDQGMHPLQVSAFLSRCFRTLLAKKSEHAQLNSELSNFWFWKNLSPVARLFSPSELRSSLSVIARLDLALKSSGISPAVQLSLAIQQLAARNFRS